MTRYIAQSRMPRRTFLKTGAAVATGWTAGRYLSARSYAQVNGANERLNLAFVGVGGRGRSNLNGLNDQNVVALCDVDDRRAADSFEAHPDATRFHDYRRMLDKLDSDIDGVVVSTPNHVHSLASVTAMRMGKHVYCEKPGAHSVYEARTMQRVAAEQGVATQLGTQIHASDNFRRIVELIRAGAIGRVNECHLWLKSGRHSSERPVETPDVPDTLKWDLFLGPAPERPYHPVYVKSEGGNWHWWWDFGGGELGNMGCHYFDLAFWALELGNPLTVEAEGPSPHWANTPARQHVRYTFASDDADRPTTLTWTHGSEPPDIFAEHDFPNWAWGVFVGEKGMLLVNYADHELLPEDDFADYDPPEPSIPDSVGHHREWVQACKGEREQSLCHFGYSMPISEAVLLGNVAYRSGRKLEWDADAFAIPNAHEAEGYLQRGYRPGWTL